MIRTNVQDSDECTAGEDTYQILWITSDKPGEQAMRECKDPESSGKRNSLSVEIKAGTPRISYRCLSG
jgi:hypothetical protein